MHGRTRLRQTIRRLVVPWANWKCPPSVSWIVKTDSTFSKNMRRSIPKRNACWAMLGRNNEVARSMVEWARLTFVDLLEIILTYYEAKEKQDDSEQLLIIKQTLLDENDKIKKFKEVLKEKLIVYQERIHFLQVERRICSNHEHTSLSFSKDTDFWSALEVQQSYNDTLDSIHSNGDQWGMILFPRWNSSDFCSSADAPVSDPPLLMCNHCELTDNDSLTGMVSQRRDTLCSRLSAGLTSEVRWSIIGICQRLESFPRLSQYHAARLIEMIDWRQWWLKIVEYTEESLMRTFSDDRLIRNRSERPFREL